MQGRRHRRGAGAISGSAENKDGLIGMIGAGFVYTPYG
jgi:hypothetical protein